MWQWTGQRPLKPSKRPMTGTLSPGWTWTMSFQIPGPSALPGRMSAGVLRRSRNHGSGQQRSASRGRQSGHQLMRRDAWCSPTMRRAFTLAALLFGTCRHEASAGTLQRYEYVFPDQSIYVYDEDDGFRLVDKVDLPGVRGIRGVAVSTSDAMLYISFGGDSGPNGNGSILKYNLLRRTTEWTRRYDTGIDSMAISPDGKRLYVPTGELSRDGIVRRTLDKAVRWVLGNRFSVADDHWWLIVEGD